MASSLLKPAPLRACARHGPLDAPAPLRLWHLASLDAPTVAVTWTLAFAWAAGIRLPVWVPAMLALGTWTVYVGDRLLDARSSLRCGAGHRLRERHFFHWRNRRVLITLAAVTATVTAAIIFALMPAAIRARNSLLGVAALAYFSGVHSRRRAPAWLALLLSKELLVGVLFTAGCALPTLTRMWLARATAAELGVLLAPAAIYAALAWLNCHAIERWESTGRSRVFITGGLLALVSLLLTLTVASLQPRLAALLAAAAFSALLLALLDQARPRLTPLALRVGADLVLLAPLLLVWR